jgi:diguanylate cyclase (GGDEF)-like protein/PAS domain S-box-containing protein
VTPPRPNRAPYLELIAAGPIEDEPLTHPDALARMAEAEDTLRAISAGEVDAFVVPDDDGGRRVFSLSTADRPYRMFVETMRDGAATVSSSGLILYANRRLAELLGCAREMVVGCRMAQFVAGTTPIAWDQLSGPDGHGLTIEVELVRPDGTVVPVLAGASPLEVDGDRMACLTFTDLSAQKAQDQEIARLGQAQAERLLDLQHVQAALTRQATHDALTGLPNRALVVDRIEQALAHSARTSTCDAVLYVDLDRFKQINDTQGHAVGDTVLRRVADQLVAALRPQDTVARVGGDEFVILAPELATYADAVDIGNRIVAELNDRTGRRMGDERAEASIGIAVSTNGRGTAEELLNEADTAMYRAKSLGGGRAGIYDAALGLQVQQWSDARKLLASALDEQRVVAHYQPIVDLRRMSVAGFEALARIELDGEVLAPSAFISVAEESGLVVPLGAQMLDLACHEAAGWAPHRPDLPPVAVAVNLAARQFGSGDLVAMVRGTLDRSGLPATSLHLELTETAIIDLHPDVLDQLRRLTELGVEIGLDDFGTGYASLTHLRRLPLAFVKIDQTFVAGLETDREDERIVAAVVDLAANLGLRSIAEGVETDGQLARLHELGCDQAQGYLFARPRPPGALRTTIDRPDG